MLVLLSCLALALAWPPSHGFAQSGDATVVVLVRHAEKETTGSDPALTAAGQARAALLASTLKDAGVTAIFATATRRTRETAAPLAALRHLDVADTEKDLTRVRAQILAAGAGKRVLIVGHSNTVPGLIAALGGPSGLEIADNEFDAFFVLTIPPQGSPTLLTLRYGAPPAAFTNSMGGPAPR
jgi:broad specificity phosphatase PhoE